MHPAEQRHLEVVTRLRRASDLGLGTRNSVESAHQVLTRKPLRELKESLALSFARDLGISGPRRIYRQDQQITYRARQLATDEPKVVTGLDEPSHEIKHGRSVFIGHRGNRVEHRLAADQAEHGRDVIDPNLLAGKGDYLIESALGVAHAAVGGTSDETERRVLNGNRLRIRDHPQLIGYLLPADGPQLVDLRSRQDRLRNLLDLRRRHHEHDVRRRLLDRLEQRVERVAGELVDLVDDVDLVSVADRCHRQTGDDHLADVLHLRVGGGVDLQHIDIAPLGDLDARVACPARIRGRPGGAIQGPRQNPRGRRLPDAAGTREHERLGEAPLGQGVAQRPGGRLLPDDVIEPLRTVLACENLVGHPSPRLVRRGTARGGSPSAQARAPPRPGRACGTCQWLLSAAAFRP